MMSSAPQVAAWAAGGLAAGAALHAHAAAAQLTLTPARTGLAGPLVSSALFAVLAIRFGPHSVLLPYSWITAVCVTASIVDLREHRLPNAIVLPAYPVLAALFTATALANQDADDLLRAAGATVVAIPLYTAIALASHGGLGAGDVKLGGLLAMALGWTSWTTVAAGTLLGWTLAAAHILLRRSTRHPDTGQPIPMGPFLSAGALAAVITTTP